jgi:hypothetical protein
MIAKFLVVDEAVCIGGHPKGCKHMQIRRQSVQNIPPTAARILKYKTDPGKG